MSLIEDYPLGLLKDCLTALGFSPTDGELELLQGFQAGVLDFNQKVNLTAITEPKEFIIKHLADSLSAEPYIPRNSSVCDIGPGGGFPSMPLKIMRRDLKFTLFEASEKKSGFINAEAARLKINGGDNDFICMHMRAEAAAKTRYRQSFDVVLARAVAPLNTLVEYALPLVKVGGRFIAYKGDADEEFTAAAHAAKLLGSGKAFKKYLTLPYSDIKRTLIIYEKTNNSPAIYPRGGNKERSKPLTL
ncbi:MAG: 16S rRNA (guanine(527)-N(7))-methyltransferase RsmG [Clostridiales bacterium]|jgi:16S rRNA (guanine527-N7)-methyltransferase|nr:16S rRNA (guanine(527)-N(7))-methyltransferase RsmG [Clostridiales bacterium]